MKKYKIVILIVLGCVGLMGFSTAVNIGIKDMFDNSGKVKQIKLSTGQTYSASTLATVFSGGSGNASYPINLAGTETTGILPQTQGGWGTNTVGTIGVVAGKIGVGTTTPTTTLQVIGTVTATGFSGNGAGLTNLVKQISGTSTGMTADNIAIVGTNSTGTFKTLTVTGTLESGAQWSTTGSSSITTGSGYNQTHTLLGTQATWIGTGTGKFDTSGLQGGSTLGTTTFTSRYNKNKFFYISDNTGTATYTLSGTTTQTIMATIPVPAGFMGTNGTFRVTSIVETGTNTGSTKTIRCRFGTGTTIADTTQLGAEQALTATSLTGACSFVFSNDGTTSSQISYTRSAYQLSSGVILGSSTVNTASATNILIVGLLSWGTETLSLRKYWVEYNE